MIPAEAVEAAAKAMVASGEMDMHKAMRAALEAAAPHMTAESDLMRWKLDVLRRWADAMTEHPNVKQYGVDVLTILEVKSLDEAAEDFGDD